MIAVLVVHLHNVTKIFQHSASFLVEITADPQLCIRLFLWNKLYCLLTNKSDDDDDNDDDRRQKKTLIILRPKYTVISNPEILIRSTFTVSAAGSHKLQLAYAALYSGEDSLAYTKKSIVEGDHIFQEKTRSVAAMIAQSHCALGLTV